MTTNSVPIIFGILLFCGTLNIVKGQSFSKEFLTLKIGQEQIKIIAKLDYSTKQHLARDFMLSNVISFIKVKPKTNRIISYTFMVAFELGQGKLDLIDILAGVIGVELNLFIRCRLFGRSKKEFTNKKG